MVRRIGRAFRFAASAVQMLNARSSTATSPNTSTKSATASDSSQVRMIPPSPPLKYDRPDRPNSPQQARNNSLRLRIRYRPIGRPFIGIGSSRSALAAPCRPRQSGGFSPRATQPPQQQSAARHASLWICGQHKSVVGAPSKAALKATRHGCYDFFRRLYDGS